MSKFFRYPTIIKDTSGNYISCINTNHRLFGQTNLLNLKEKNFPLNLNYYHKKKARSYNTINFEPYVVHNFTIFKDLTDTFYYGIGGLNRDQHPYNVEDENNGNACTNNGLFLYKSYDIINWEKLPDINPIISVNKFPKNPIIGIEQIVPECDSNICCFYSKIFKTYLLFIRANIAIGCRSTQITTTTDFINFTDFKLLNIDTFLHLNNNYMFKCVEILEYNVFFALVPFTNKPAHPSQHYIKKLLSYDTINWIDCGVLRYSDMNKDIVHINMHIAEILYSNNTLEIILQENCTWESSFLTKETFKINENPSEKIDIKEFICKIRMYKK